MNDLVIFLLLIGAIWLVILATYKKLSLSKRGFTLSPAILMWKTTRGLKFIDRIGKKFRKWWIFYGTVAACLGFLLMFSVFAGLLSNSIFVLLRPREAIPGVRFILPGTAPGLTITIWFIVVGVVLIFHEVFHAFLLRSQGLRTKSAGVLLFLFIPGAFVEPDERQVIRSSPGKRMRMFAAGPVTNILISFLFLLILLSVLTPKQGVYIWGVAENSPLAEENILGAKILALDNFQISSIEDVKNFKNYLNASRRTEFELVTDRGTFHAKIRQENGENHLPFIAAQAPSNLVYLHPINTVILMYATIFGSPVFHPYLYHFYVPPFLIDLLKWLFALNLGIGLFNLLPAKPLDGGYMLEALLEVRYSKKFARGFVKAFSFFILLLIILNLLPMIVRA